ncbi:RNA-dependent RNA polymerase 1 [Amaranthus tricolor]|uniref:RNA-dependent RNA polymerase 1 n=1 Tax=Amaranthus tricolor TaxID=29722 RepID=UPI00258C07FA|nr:RNA-dependent RNA polymerase 1 [Amaranthus tricolor]XP_057550247.1 RNA-dependent RNA polymerase 1 [Amaranthus tricolor]XP_057550248.1 RNA-dependent RNA polymerase 1 [Amaranthus tricolor]
MGKTIQLSGFPSTVSAEAVKTFLEGRTGKGTVVALKIRQFKTGGTRCYAIVQFTTARIADFILKLSLPPQKFWYGSSFLKGREMEHDIVPKPRTYQHTMENISLHVGCQISEEEFVAFWTGESVSLSFGLGLRKFYFYFECLSIEYKLELSYESIWQIELRCPRHVSVKYLLIQLFEAPKIFEKLRFPVLIENNYFKDEQDDQWFRTTDFTFTRSFGQSSVICLELPYNCQLPDFKANFAYFKEDDGQFTLRNGSTFSHNMELVPIVDPPRGLDLPFHILYKVNHLVQFGCLPGPNLDRSFFQMVDPRRMDNACIEYALENMYYLKECCYNPVEWLRQQYTKYLTSRRSPQKPTISLDAGLVYVRRVQVTPSRVYFCGPEVNISNRVLRNYPNDIDNFLRISFVDENLVKLYSTDLAPRFSSDLSANVKRTNIDRRIRSTLRNGIVIGDKKFEFLAFSSSQLRENSAWMFASRPGLSAAGIRNWMGNFRSIRNVAKYAARLGQSFGSSTESLTVPIEEVEMLPDVKLINGRNIYIFSDGIGKISLDFARKVAKKCGYSFTPSAFQIRYGGFKGVVAVDPLSSKKLSLRDSMSKYKSDNDKLDVLAYSKYQPCYMNRQLITLLSTLGVPDCVFEKKQREVLKQLDDMLKDPLKAQEALELMCPGELTNILKEMLKCGYKPDAEPFLSMMLQTFRASKLQELRTKSRIFLPLGRAMMGCLDETKTLEYGQVFVQVSGARFRNVGNELLTCTGSEFEPNTYVVKGKIVVAKNPCLHPGDVRILKAVDVPSLHHMVDCVVFPQKGKRPHPNECSGSDLDGDIYFVCWDSDLVPPRQEEPMDYTAAKSTELDHDVTMEDVMDYFTDYIVNDSLGIIANAHTAFADKEIMKAMSSQCIELAKLFSVAVDFPKTGVPAVIPHYLHVKEYPDFMDKPDKPTYKSLNVIGKLFREVKERSPSSTAIRSYTRDIARSSCDPDMEYDGFEDYLDDAEYYKSQYDYKLGNLMDYYGITTEAEILSGNILRMSKSFDKRKDAEAVTMAVRALRKEARVWFNKKMDDVEPDSDELYAKASAWYYVTYHPKYFGVYNEGLKRDHFLSFPWCVYDRLITIKKNKKRSRNVSSLESLENQLRYGISLRE